MLWSRENRRARSHTEEVQEVSNSAVFYAARGVLYVAFYTRVIEDRAPRRGTGRLRKSCCLLRAGRARMSRRRLVRSTAQKCTVFHHQAQ